MVGLFTVLEISDFKEAIINLSNRETTVFQVAEMFMTQESLEAVVLPKDGNPKGCVFGIIRLRDLYNNLEKE